MRTIAQESKPQDETISLERVEEPGEEEDQHRGRSGTISPPDSSSRDFSPWSDTSSDSQPYEASYPTKNSIISENMRNVEKMLDQLARIAIAIRKSGTSSRLQKADKTLNINDHKELRSHLITIILSQKQLHGVKSFSPGQIDPDTCGLTAVQFRLIDCNLKRRNRFLYAQKHSKALNTQVSSGDTLSEKKIHQESESRYQPQQEHAVPVRSVLPPVSAEPAEQRQNVSVNTGTSASRVPDQFVIPQNRVPSQASTTQLSTTVMKLDYPHPPKVNPKASVFRCPCCCQSLPASMHKKHRWM